MYLGVRKSAHENRTFYGQIRGFRVSKKARYASNFSVPKTFRLKNDDDTVVLLNFDKVAEKKVFDESGHEHHGKLEGAELVRYGK